MNIATPKQFKGRNSSLYTVWLQSEEVGIHRLWELADSEEAIISKSDCLFVYLSGEERMEETLNRASTPSSSPKLQLKQFNPIELSTYDCGMLILCYFIQRGTQSQN